MVGLHFLLQWLNFVLQCSQFLQREQGRLYARELFVELIKMTEIDPQLSTAFQNLRAFILLKTHGKWKFCTCSSKKTLPYAYQWEVISLWGCKLNTFHSPELFANNQKIYKKDKSHLCCPFHWYLGKAVLYMSGSQTLPCAWALEDDKARKFACSFLNAKFQQKLVLASSLP